MNRRPACALRGIVTVDSGRTRPATARPRESGKTSFVKKVFANRFHDSLEGLDMRDTATVDLRHGSRARDTVPLPKRREYSK